jgi:hypothetical protein
MWHSPNILKKQWQINTVHFKKFGADAIWGRPTAMWSRIFWLCIYIIRLNGQQLYILPRLHHQLPLTTHVPVDPSRCPAHRCPARMGTEWPYLDRHTEFVCRGILASSSLAVRGPVRLACPQPVAMQDPDADGNVAACSGRHIDCRRLPTGPDSCDSFRSAVNMENPNNTYQSMIVVCSESAKLWNSWPNLRCPPSPLINKHSQLQLPDRCEQHDSTDNKQLWQLDTPRKNAWPLNRSSLARLFSSNFGPMSASANRKLDAQNDKPTKKRRRATQSTKVWVTTVTQAGDWAPTDFRFMPTYNKSC